MESHYGKVPHGGTFMLLHRPMYKEMYMEIEQIKRYGKEAKGRKELIEYLTGKRLTPRKAILGKCYECMNAYADGKVDCNISDCSLYPFMPYRKGGKLVLRKMSEGQKEKITCNLRRKRPTDTLIAQYYA